MFRLKTAYIAASMGLHKLLKCDGFVIVFKNTEVKQHEMIRTEYADMFARQTIGFLVRRTAALMSKRLNEALGEHDITLSHWVVLSCLWQKDGLPVMYLSSQLQHIGGTVSDLLSRMEKRKLIKRRRDRKDRRILRVYLTEESLALSKVLPPIVHRIWHQAWQNISESDLKKFADILERMIHNCEPEYSVCLPEAAVSVAPKYQLILPPRSTGYRLKLLQLMLTRRFNDALEEYKLSASHTLVLFKLWQDDGIPVSEIGTYLEQVGGSLTGVLERMEENGLIRREQDEKDKRCFRVWLTEQGDDLIEIIPPIARKVLNYAARDISDSDITFFKKCLNTMLYSASSHGKVPSVSEPSSLKK